ncbi:MAG: hypothetical protein SynsKO_35680 [Synoicihabitans sp.]
MRDERDKQRKTDAGQLKVLMVLHYVFAGLSTLGLGFLYLHHRLMDLMMNTPEMWEQSDQGPPPEEFFALFQYFYLFMGVMIVVFAAANALSARFIQTRRHRIYSLIVAGLNCVLFPFGTALGVFSFIVLLRDSVEENYRLSSAEN